MKTNIHIRYLQQIRHFKNEDCLLHTIAYHAAPVLEKYKPAVILNFTDNRCRQLNQVWQENKNTIPWTDGFKYYELLQTCGRSSVLFYNPFMLKKVLQDKAAAGYLLSCGYQRKLTLKTVLADLKSRYQTGCPHEIGLFLGIPLDDVLGFIRYGGKETLADGYWKVYHDLDQKLKLFNSFQEARLSFVRFILAGNQPGDYLVSKLVV